MTFLLVFLIYGSPPDVTALRLPDMAACRAEAMTRADAAMRERRRVWFRCMEVTP